MNDLSVVELHTPPDDFLTKEPEGASFHKAYLAATSSDCAYLAIYRAGLRIAVIPYFLGQISPAALLPACLLKRLVSRLKFSYACVGHPSNRISMIAGEISADVLAQVNRTLFQKAPLVIYKGFHKKLPLAGYIRMNAPPLASLTFKEAYFFSPERDQRNAFKKKLGNVRALRVEASTALPAQLVPQVFQLYLNSQQHATLHLEQLTLAYFHGTVALSKFLLFFEADVLIGFIQIIGKNKKAVFKYTGMNYFNNSQNGLYYLMHLKAIEVCFHEGYQRLELGVIPSDLNQLLGCEPVKRLIYYRHNNAFINWLLGKYRILIAQKITNLE